MGPIIQTLTLATILLIIGLVCLLLGVAGLMWSIGRDKQRREKTMEDTAAETFGEIGDNAFHQPSARETSLKS